jgi:PAS domain S-box-containing protein
VQFYETDDFLLDSVSDFIGAGLGSGAACIVIATPAHREGLVQRLQANGLNPSAAHARGKYFALDAAETLAQLLLDEAPDPKQFARIIGGVIEHAVKGQKRVRIFGEMVALLWQQGKQEAALRLEALWNELRSTTHPFSLFCAYPMSLFAEQVHEKPFTKVCDRHSQVIPSESYSQLSCPDERLRAVSLFQQKALSLEAEIAQRKAAEETLLHLAAIVSSSNDAIISKDLDGTITSWNAAAERIYGYSAQEIVGQPITLLFPSDRQNEFTQIIERICRGECVDHYETTRVRKDGNHVNISVTISPIKNTSGTIIGASAIARDITERKELEQQREAFVGLVTHELKTPLTILQGNVQLAQRRLTRMLNQTEQLTGEQQRWLEDILTMLARTQQPLRVQQRLINDLLDITHIREDKLELDLAIFDLIGLVYETIQDHQAVHPNRLITLDLPEQDSVPVHADRDRVQQVLSNYLTNALKFAPATKPIQVGMTLEAGTIRVWVQDQGPGLTPQQQAHIWKRCYQVSQTPVQDGWKMGLGLGLYICQQLIQRQQGEVGVESIAGQGATFWFTLPVHAA